MHGPYTFIFFKKKERKAIFLDMSNPSCGLTFTLLVWLLVRGSTLVRMDDIGYSSMFFSIQF